MRAASVGRSAPLKRDTRLIRAATMLALAVIFAIVIFRPLAARWSTRESAISDSQTTLAELEHLVNNRAATDSIADSREAAFSQNSNRVLRAKSRALAASALQSLMLELAEGSNVTVNRLDVAALESTGDLPFELSANGDIFGLTELLQRIRTARYVVNVRKLSVQNNSALRGAPDVLQVTLSLDAPVIVR